MNTNNSTIWTRDFILLCLATLLMATAFYFLIPTLPVFITEIIKAEKGVTGAILAAFTVSALIVRPFVGYALDRWGRKVIYLISFFLMMLLFNGYVFASTIFLMVLMRLAHGFAWGITSTAGSTIVVDLLPPSKRGDGLGIFGLAMPLAMSLGPLLGIFIVQKMDYASMFISGSFVCLLGFFLLLFIKYPHYPLPEKPKPFSAKNLIEKKSIPMSVNVIFLILAYGGIISFISLYAKECKVTDTSLFFILFAIGIGVARIFAGKIFDRKGPKGIYTAGILLLTTGLCILAFAKNSHGLHIAAIILGIGNGTIFPVTQAIVNNMVEIHRRGAANSTLFTAFDLGIGAGMVITGTLSDIVSLSNTYLFFAIMCIASLIHAHVFVFPHYDKNKIK